MNKKEELIINFFVVVVYLLIFWFIMSLGSCSNPKNLYTNYPTLPENKTDTIYLPYHFVE